MAIPPQSPAYPNITPKTPFMHESRREWSGSWPPPLSKSPFVWNSQWLVRSFCSDSLPCRPMTSLCLDIVRRTIILLRPIETCLLSSIKPSRRRQWPVSGKVWVVCRSGIAVATEPVSGDEKKMKKKKKSFIRSFSSQVRTPNGFKKQNKLPFSLSTIIPWRKHRFSSDQRS